MSRNLDEQPGHSRGLLWIIAVISIVVPLLVAMLIFKPSSDQQLVSWVSFLPHLNGAINSTTAALLLIGLYFIKQGNLQWHKMSMLSAFILGSVFLISYITYHASAPSTKFGDLDHDGALSILETDVIGNMRAIYLILLLSHILMAIVVVPFVLLGLYRALKGEFEAHKKVVKYGWPIWLYVSISGVLVYLMIRPYYP